MCVSEDYVIYAADWLCFHHCERCRVCHAAFLLIIAAALKCSLSDAAVCHDKMSLKKKNKTKKRLARLELKIACDGAEKK